MRPTTPTRMSDRRRAGRGAVSTLAALAALVVAGLLLPGLRPARAAEPASSDASPPWLRDRGAGMPTSMFGTYVRHGELLVYPFFEAYADHDFEYKPEEFGHGSKVDYRGDYEASEGLLFVAYGLRPNLSVELEAAIIDAEISRAPDDPSTMPEDYGERGLGDVEGQIRWRIASETARRPEFFSFFETVFPLQRHRRLIGTRDWEFKLGFGATRGFGWGTLTARTAAEYSLAENKFEPGEYAIEYLKRVSRTWRVVGAIEGNQVDEIALITEGQWHFSRRAFLKLNNGWGLTQNATDLAPEVGLMLLF